MEDYSAIEVYTGRDFVPQKQEQELQAAQTSNGVMAVEQTRAVAEVQAALVIAASRPRDENNALERLKAACTREGFAASAMYVYKRGNEEVSGPSIRLAEAAARSWGNMNYGFRELARRPGVGQKPGESDCEAFAWDLETNIKAVRQFTVKHWRDTKKGGYALKDERDIYELVANQSQRRVRAMILEIVPGDIIDDAVAQCEETMVKKLGPIDKAAKKLVSAFEKEFGVTQAQIEELMGCSLTAIKPVQIFRFRRIYMSIKEGVTTVKDWFGASAADPPQKPPVATAQPKEEAKEKPQEVGAIQQDSQLIPDDTSAEVHQKEEEPEVARKKKVSKVQQDLIDALMRKVNDDEAAAEALFRSMTKEKYGIADIKGSSDKEGFSEKVCDYYIVMLRQQEIKK